MMSNDIRTQSSLGSNWIKITQENMKMTDLTLAKVIKVYYEYQTVELKTLYGNTNLGLGNGTNGQFSAPFPKSYTAYTPENEVYGEIPTIVPGQLVLVGFIGGNHNNPIVINTYGVNELNKQLTRTPLISGDMRNDRNYKLNSASFKVHPSLNYEYHDGEGNISKSWNGNTFLSITSDDTNLDTATDIGLGTLFTDLSTSYYTDGSLIESRIKRSPTMLFKHQGFYDMFGNPDNHVTMFYLDSDGTYRRSIVNETESFRQTLVQDHMGTYRIRTDYNSLDLDQGTEFIEFGIDSMAQEFFINNNKFQFLLDNNGLFVNGKPLLQDVDNDIKATQERLDSLNKSLTEIEKNVQDTVNSTLNDFIEKSNKAIEDANSAMESVSNFEQKIQSVSRKADSSITKQDNFVRDVYTPFSTKVDSFMTNVEPKITNLTDVQIPSINANLKNKANKSDLDNKADKSELDSKADKSELQEKADQTTVNGLSTNITNLTDKVNNLTTSNSSNKDYTPVFKRNSTVIYKGVEYQKNEPIYDYGGVRVSSTESLEIPVNFDYQQGTIQFEFIPLDTNLGTVLSLDTTVLTVSVTSSHKINVTLAGTTLESLDTVSIGSVAKVAIKWSTYSSLASVFLNGVFIGNIEYDSTTSFGSKVYFNKSYSSFIRNIKLTDKFLSDYEIQGVI